MRNIVVGVLLIGIIGCSSSEKKEQTETIVYPETKKDTSVVDDYFGTKINDPYRWLEDDNSPETEAWVKAQNKLTYTYLDKIPQREYISNRMTELWNFEKMSTPWFKGDYSFYYKNNGTQNQSVLYYNSKGKGEQILIDPNTFSEDGTVALSGLGINKDATHIAYMVSKAGSDWRQIFVKEIETGKILSDTVNWVKFSGIAWQGEGFYYSRYDEPKEGEEYSASNINHKVYYHKVGTSQKEDELVKSDDSNPKWNFVVSTSEDETMEYLWVSESTSGYQLWVKGQQDSDFRKIDNTFENEYSIVDVVDNSLLVITNNGASQNRLVRISLDNLDSEAWEELIPEDESALLESATKCGDKLLVKHLKDVTSKLSVYSLEGKKLNEVELPGPGMVSNMQHNEKENKVYFTFTNYTTPKSVYVFDLNTNECVSFWKPTMDFNNDEYITKQLFYKSKDGTKIPLFVTHKKGIKMDGNNPTFIYGYGGFNISKTPVFGIENTVFLEQGGVYAVANIRGGGEYGEEWHKAGTLLQKQNVFDDFIGAAEYLIAEKYTSSEKLAVHGRSNGGLLIGAVMTQRPDLFKVCLPKVGVLDMLRYHQFTIGRAWAVDYGLSEEEEHFKNLLSYSPLHNVKEVSYPATMVQTGDHDDRVVPAHSFKFAATLQEKNTGKNPMLIRVDVNAGHGAGKPVSMQIAEFTDAWAFVFHHLGMEVPVTNAKQK